MRLYSDRLDAALARLSLKYRPVGRWFAFWGLLRSGYSPLAAFRLVKNYDSTEVQAGRTVVRLLGATEEWLLKNYDSTKGRR
jgi:hypothetical protein